MTSIVPAKKNTTNDESGPSVDVFFAGTDVDSLAEKLSLLMPSLINKIVQRELQKEA
ncbi:MAG: hypothetical protein WCO65_00820 [bacterium]